MFDKKCLRTVFNATLVSHAATAFLALVTIAPSKGQARDLRDLVRQFQSSASLTFQAIVELDLNGEVALEMGASQSTNGSNSPLPIFGTLDYSASGEKYIISSQMDPHALPGMQMSVAWNGVSFQMLLPHGVFTFSSTEKHTILPVVLNPLFELLAFRYPLTDDNSQFLLRYQDIQQDAPPDPFWLPEWTEVNVDGNPLMQAVFPGGVYEQHPYEIHVLANQGQLDKPVRIDSVGLDGHVYASRLFSDYRQIDTSTGTGWWPYQVNLQEFDEQGALAANASYWLTDLCIDCPEAEHAFALPLPPSSHIWDDDQARFVTQLP